MNPYTTRRWLARGAVLTVSAAALLQPVASSAQDSTTEKERDRVREQQAEVGREVDALRAEDAEVQEALSTLAAEVALQQAELEEAERVADAAAAEVTAAERAVEEAERRIADLDRATDELVVEAFVDPPSSSVLDVLSADSMSDATVKKSLLDMAADSDADLLDELEAAHEDLEVQRAEKEQLAAVAEQKRAEARERLAELEDALARQERLATDLEDRLDRKLAEAEALKEQDRKLSEQLAREQEELARKLRALHEANERAARERAAAQAASAAPSVPAPAAAPAPPPAPSRSTIRPAPGGLATVACPRGGSITVAGSIAENVRALLDHAAADGLALCGTGYRDPQRQIELRRQHCGTSTYAIYHMPSSMCRPPTARPGRSLHERGLAIDFTCNGGSMGGSPCFRWLSTHASRYGLYNLPSEPWHWSTTGN